MDEIRSLRHSRGRSFVRAPGPAAAFMATLLLASAAPARSQGPRAASQWPVHGGDGAETRYSELSQIHTGNVGQLEVAWQWPIPKTGARLETTPLVVDGVIYGTGPMSLVFALDARTGAQKWVWDPSIPDQNHGGPRACCGNVNRGVAVHEGKVFAGLLDGRLVALDRSSGEVIWSVQTTPPNSDYTITGAPRVVAGKVVIGNGGAEYGVRGYITAYDAATGRQLWRTYTVPGNPALGFETDAMRRAAATWTGEWWKYGGGGTVWDAMAWDSAANLLYIGTGNGSPWSRDHRSPGGGDNLFLSSILAIDADAGEIVWHYQTTPGDDWDYTATQPLMLLDLAIGGRERQVIVQAPKNGFFYVIDRLTGEFVSAKPFADDLTWASGVDARTGRPLETAIARYGKLPDGVYLSPGPTGAHNWFPMSWSATTGFVYIPAQNTTYLFRKADALEFRPGQWNTGTGGRGRSQPQRPALKGPDRVLLAWDPVGNREVWRVPATGGHGGTLATAGNLVFWGSGTQLVALDARSGASLWSAQVGQGTASPITYAIDGRQYVTIAAGIGESDSPRVWTFTLPSR
jgi:PQQ-dependent dehydrogenase (methanol/ethanol family)